jgi:effector-binding domain-containing protein
MSFKYEIKDQKAVPTASIRTRTSLSQLPEVIQKSYKEISEHLADTGNFSSGAPFAIYYNMDINNFDVELGFPVAEKIGETDVIKNSLIPAGKVLQFTHIGPYWELEKTYDSAMNWIKENNISTTGTICEFYLNDPAVTPPVDLETEIRFFIR